MPKEAIEAAIRMARGNNKWKAERDSTMRSIDDAKSTEDMTDTALPWQAYPEPLRTTYELCDGNGVTVARGMQRAVAEAVAVIVNQRDRLRGGE